MRFFEKKETSRMSNKELKELLRSFTEFERAYSELKDRYMNEIHLACDSLDLVDDEEFVYNEDNDELVVEVNQFYEIVACKNFSFIIREREE